MNFFRKWFAKQCKRAWDDAANGGIERDNSIPIKQSTRTIDSPGMNFMVYRANGGYIIETRKYDLIRGDNSHNLHIITDDKDLGNEISKLITFESLR